MSGECLDISEASSVLAYVARRIGDEGTPAGMAGAAIEPKRPIPIPEGIHDNLRVSRFPPPRPNWVSALNFIQKLSDYNVAYNGFELKLDARFKL
jgi:hypothetical protein